MQIDDALRCIDAQFHVAQVPADETGRHCYQFGQVTVGLSEAHPEGFLAARAWIGRMDPGDAGSLMTLAQANLSLPIAPEAHLCLDGVGEVYLDQRIGGEHLSDDMFLDTLERLVGEALAWQQRLAQVEATAGMEA